MIAVGVYKGRTVKRVTIIGVVMGDLDSEILDLAMDTAGESSSSLFGSDIVKFDGGLVNVDLHTD